jgi:hypothetical protein
MDGQYSAQGVEKNMAAVRASRVGNEGIGKFARVLLPE